MIWLRCSIFRSGVGLASLASLACLACLACPASAQPLPGTLDGGAPLGASAAARAPAPTAADDRDETAFNAAVQLAGRDDAKASERFLALYAASPDGEYADDALIEAAQLAEEKLGRPAEARDLYARLLERLPHSRYALRARARLAFLDANLKTGAGPLAEYQAILFGYAQRPPAESKRRMEALLVAHPEFALADPAALWLAGLEAREGNSRSALTRYLSIEAQSDGREAWALARKGRAEVLLSTGHPYAARALYRSILEAPPAVCTPPLADSARAGIATATRLFHRQLLAGAAILYLIGFVGLGLGLARRLRAEAPASLGATSTWLSGGLAFYLPVAALFFVCGATENRSITIATSVLSIGGALLVHAAARGVDERLRRGPLGVGAGLRAALAIVLAVVALFYIAIYAADVIDMVLETFVEGPDR